MLALPTALTPRPSASRIPLHPSLREQVSQAINSWRSQLPAREVAEADPQGRGEARRAAELMGLRVSGTGVWWGLELGLETVASRRPLPSACPHDA